MGLPGLQVEEAKKEKSPEEIYKETLGSAATTAAGLTAIAALGAVSPGTAFR